MPEILDKAKMLPGKGTLQKSGANFWSIRLCEEWQREFLSRYFTTEICINDSVQVQDNIIAAFDRAVAWGKTFGLSGTEIQTGFFTERTKLNPSNQGLTYSLVIDSPETQYILLGFAPPGEPFGPKCNAGSLHEGAQISFEVTRISTLGSQSPTPRVPKGLPKGTMMNFPTQWFFCEVTFSDFMFVKKNSRSS